MVTTLLGNLRDCKLNWGGWGDDLVVMYAVEPQNSSE